MTGATDAKYNLPSPQSVICMDENWLMTVFPIFVQFPRGQRRLSKHFRKAYLTQLLYASNYLQSVLIRKEKMRVMKFRPTYRVVNTLWSALWSRHHLTKLAKWQGECCCSQRMYQSFRQCREEYRKKRDQFATKCNLIKYDKRCFQNR